MTTTSNDLPEVELPEPDFPRLRTSVIGFTRQEYISIPTLGWKSVSNWPEREWRKAIEQGQLAAWKMPTGRIYVKTQDVLDFIMGFATPVQVGKGD